MGGYIRYDKDGDRKCMIRTTYKGKYNYIVKDIILMGDHPTHIDELGLVFHGDDTIIKISIDTVYHIHTIGLSDYDKYVKGYVSKMLIINNRKLSIRKIKKNIEDKKKSKNRLFIEGFINKIKKP